MVRSAENWNRMSRGCPLPEMVLEYPDGEVEHIPKSWQAFYALRQEGTLNRPTKVTIQSDITKEALYTAVYPSMHPIDSEVVLIGDII